MQTDVQYNSLKVSDLHYLGGQKKYPADPESLSQWLFIQPMYMWLKKMNIFW